MPSADSPARSLRVRSPTLASPARSDGRSRAGGGRPRGGGGHDGPSWTGGRVARPGRRQDGAGVGDDVPVEHLDAAPHPGGDRVVVGDDDDRGPGGVELLQQGQDGGAIGGVEVAGGLVGQHHRRAAGDRPGYRDPLPLAPGQLGRPGGGPVPEPDPVQRGGREPPPLVAADPGVQQPVGDVAQHGLMLGQEELLEYEPDPGRPQRRQLPVGHPGHVQAGDAHRPAGRLVQGAHQVQQRADLPDPDGPTMAVSSPAVTARLTPASARTGGDPGYTFVTCSSSSTARRKPVRGCPGREGPPRVGGHDAGTTTRCPGVSAPVTCTSPSASSKIPDVTGT